MKHLRPALLLTALFIVVTGLVFPAVVWALGQTLFPRQAGGSLIRDAQGRLLGSALLGQGFTTARYFHPRPSAAGRGYDAANSGGTNLAPSSAQLGRELAALARLYRAENALPSNVELPADAVTRSGSGLDPDISPANAQLQIARVAKARATSPESIRQLLARHTQGRTLGLIGEPRVNVLELNLALDREK